MQAYFADQSQINHRAIANQGNYFDSQVPWFSLGATLLARTAGGAVGERDGRYRGNANRSPVGFKSGMKLYQIFTA